MKHSLLRLLTATATTVVLLSGAAGAQIKGTEAFEMKDQNWYLNSQPYFSTTAHAIFHKFRKDRKGATEDLRNLKAAGFTIVEAYWDWRADHKPDNTYDFKDFDEFVLAAKEVGLPVFVMFSEYHPGWLADKLGWGHLSEEGERIVRVDDFYVCNPSFKRESKRFYETLINHLKQRPEVSENILYWNIGGEYKPFMPHRQPKNLDHGYDDYTVKAFRKWMQDKGWTLQGVADRWGAGAYKNWDEVWPSINMKKADYKGRPLRKWNAARWDWYDFRQEVSTQHFHDVIKWIREAGETRPLIHEYNIITPGSMAMFLRWSRVGAREGKDGIHLATGTFDREFDYNSLLYNLTIARGASTPPWQSNEQKGNTTPPWMTKHAWLMFAMGGTGIHYWDWRSKDWGVVQEDGSPSQGYPSAVRLNHQFDYLGDPVIASKPMPNRIGALVLAEESLHAPRGRDREISFIHKTLLDLGSGMETALITDDEVLFSGIEDYRLIIVPGQVRMRQAVREKLTQWVKNGGTLWLTPGSASRNQLDDATTTNPGYPLNLAAGVELTATKTSLYGQLKTAIPDGPYANLEHIGKIKTAKPVAWINGRAAIWKNNYGKGVCYLQAAHTTYLPQGDTPLSRDEEGLAAYLKSNGGQLPKELLRTALAEEGIPAYVRVISSITRKPLTTVLTGLRQYKDGYVVVLIEGDNRQSDVRVALDEKRVQLKDDWAVIDPMTLEQVKTSDIQSFRTTLNPAEVKVFLVLPSSKAVETLAYYRARDWQARVATLPAIPEQTLIPPDEIGKVELADLENVQPKPHGDNFLLLDLSKHANRSLIDEGKQEQAKSFLGSVGIGDNDLNNLPTGLQMFEGDVPFYIMDPQKYTNSCLITKTIGRPWLGPLAFENIPVRSRATSIHWLYGSGWAPDLMPVGYAVYNYADGSKAEENIICNKNINNWWGYGGPPQNPKLKRAWSGSTPAASRNYTTVGLWHYEWVNPHPDKEIKSIDIRSYGGDACIITVAITAEM